VSEDVERHRRACAGWATVVGGVEPGRWEVPTPCSEWDAGALVEHVIGFHEFLLLRPVGRRADRPRRGPAPRWRATDVAIQQVLADPALLDAPIDYFDGGTRRPRELLGALTTDVLVHTWDLARATGTPDRLDPELCDWAWHDARRTDPVRQASALYAAPVPVPGGSDPQTHLLGLLGRDPSWAPRPATPR